MDIQTTKRFLVGGWCVTPDEGTLSRDGHIERLEPLAMQALVYLASRAGEVVLRAELEHAVWKGGVVGYDSVTGTVIKLRKAFGDDARKPCYIATIPKRGYQLIASVERDCAPDAPELAQGTASTETVPRKRRPSLPVVAASLVLAMFLALGALYVLRTDRSTESIPTLPRMDGLPSLVVLPFADLSEESEKRHLADGITEGLITSLSRLSGLRVIARSSAFAFAGEDADPREAARLLRARYVLQGSMFSAGGKIRVNAKLVDSESGAYLWAEQFDGEARDLFTLQDSVAGRTARALSVTLTDKDKKALATPLTTNFAAYDYYLRGRVTFGSLTERESALARAMYLRAIREDPGFALAYAGLALTYIDEFRGRAGADRETAASKAIEYAEQAAALDDTLPQAHFALGYVRLYAQADHEGAIFEAKRALAENPNYADAYALLSSAYFFAGELNKTLELDREAMQLNPAAGFVYDMHLGRKYFLEGRFRKALDFFLMGAAKDYNYVPTQVWLAATYAKLGDLDEAAWAAEQVRILMPEFAIDDWMQFRPYKKPEHREALVEGLKLSGLE